MHHSRSLNYTFLLKVYNNKRGLICLGERQVATKRAEDDSERLLCRPARTLWKRLYNWYKSTDDNKIWLHVCEKFNLQLSLGNLVKLNSYLTFIDIRMTLTLLDIAILLAQQNSSRMKHRSCVRSFYHSKCLHKYISTSMVEGFPGTKTFLASLKAVLSRHERLRAVLVIEVLTTQPLFINCSELLATY